MTNVMDALKRIDEKKKQLDEARPLPVALVRNLQEWFAIEFTHTSNALEGNTLSLSETAMVVEKGITIGGKTVREHLEAINHAHAINFIEELAHKQRADLVMDDILAIHKIIVSKIDDLIYDFHAGAFRKAMVLVAGTAPFLMDEFMAWLHSTTDHPVIVAALAHYKLVSIHPFIDGNGRTARLLMNLLLLQCGYPLAIIKKEQRGDYIAAIEHARNTDDFAPFYAVILQAIEYTLDSYLEAMSESDLS